MYYHYGGELQLVLCSEVVIFSEGPPLSEVYTKSTHKEVVCVEGD